MMDPVVREKTSAVADEPSATPRVSVISIFYNASAFLPEAIDSVLNQNFQDFELLLVDDGSTDESTSIAQGFAASDPDRIRYLSHPGKVNRGMSATRNLGLSAARGDFVAFIDADDRWAPGKLDDQIAILDSVPEVDAVCGTVRYWQSWNGGPDRIVPTGHVQDRPVPPPQASLALYPLGQAGAPCPSDLMIRRSAVSDVGGFEESFMGPLQMYEDQAFLAKFYLEKTIYFADRIWLDYRIHDQSFVSGVIRQGRYQEVRRHFLEWFRDYLEHRPVNHSETVKAAVDRALQSLQRPGMRGALLRVVSRLRKVHRS